MNKNYAIRLNQFGNEDVLKYMQVDINEPSNHEVVIKHEAIGLNFIDVYFRSGLYPINLPSGLGCEGAGTIESIGKDVTDFKVGDRIAYCSPPPLDAYSMYRTIDASKIVKIPDELSFELAAASMLKGLTVWYLLHETYQVQKNETIVVYAAAGGVGSILVQWAASLGAKVIGIVSNEQKRQIALANGCEHVIIDSEKALDEFNEITNHQGVKVVYDSVGQATLNASLAMLAPRGLLVSYGNASGPVDNFSFSTLAKHGSLYVTRPTLWSYISNHHDLMRSSSLLFEKILNNAINIEIGQTYALSNVAQAHHELSNRMTTGSSILLPE